MASVAMAAPGQKLPMGGNGNLYDANHNPAVLHEISKSLGHGHSVKTAATRSSELITEAPAGTKQLYLRSGGAYFTFWGTAYNSDYDSLNVELVEGEDGYVYFPNFISQMTTNTYVKGERKDGKIVVELPQMISQDVQDGETVSFYVDRLTYDENEGYFFASATDEIRYVEFSIDEDGQLEMLDTDKFNIVGIVDEAGVWCGYGDYDSIFTPFTESVVTPPADLATSVWSIGYDAKGHIVNIGFDGSDIYVQGIYPSLPDAWIKGTVDGDTIVFPSYQYLGVDPTFANTAFFCGGRYEEVYLPSLNITVNDLVMLPEATFHYDEANQVISTDECPLVSGSVDEVRAYAKFPNATFAPRRDDQSPVPATPIYGNYMEYNEEYGYGFIRFDFPATNIDGDVLDTKNLYFRFLVDGEPYLFEPDLYTALSEAVTEVPYDFSGVGLTSYGSMHYVYFYFDAYEALAIQTVYKAEDKDYYSDILQIYGETVSVDPNMTGGDVVEVAYYNLAGQKVSNPSHGVFMRVEYLDNGMKSVKKIAIK